MRNSTKTMLTVGIVASALAVVSIPLMASVNYRENETKQEAVSSYYNESSQSQASYNYSNQAKQEEQSQVATQVAVEEKTDNDNGKVDVTYKHAGEHVQTAVQKIQDQGWAHIYVGRYGIPTAQQHMYDVTIQSECTQCSIDGFTGMMVAEMYYIESTDTVVILAN